MIEESEDDIDTDPSPPAPQADTATIEALAPDDARRLVAGWQDTGLYLDRLRALDAATEAALAGFGGRQLSLGGLTALDLEMATALAHIAGSLYLTEELQWEFRTTHPLTAETAAARLAVTGDQRK